MRKKTVQEMNRITAEQFRAAQKLPVVAVLDNVRSQHNIGAVFRTADAFRIEEVCLCGICCCPPNTEIHKTALGAEDSVRWTYVQDTLEAVRDLQARGYAVYAVEQTHGSISLEEAAEQWSKPQEGKKGIAVVFGHEVFGVQQEVADAADGCIEIPQYGTKHSLNVSVTAGIVLYRIAQAIMPQIRLL
jgi:tRNA G18 (ribose-2'-O)-methylase SpoU